MRVHDLTQDERPQLGPDLRDVSEALRFRAAVARAAPVGGKLAVRGPDRVRLFLVNDHGEVVVSSAVWSDIGKTFELCAPVGRKHQNQQADDRRQQQRCEEEAKRTEAALPSEKSHGQTKDEVRGTNQKASLSAEMRLDLSGATTPSRIGFGGWPDGGCGGVAGAGFGAASGAGIVRKPGVEFSGFTRGGRTTGWAPPGASPSAFKTSGRPFGPPSITMIFELGDSANCNVASMPL